jgi:uncharacterized membrane protein YgcG
MPPRDLEAATMGGADHPTTRKKRTQTVAWAALLVFVALLQLLVYHMHSVRHHVGSFGRSARERERVVLPRGGDDDGRGDGGRVGEGDDGVGTSKSKSNGGGGGGGAGFRRAGDVVGLDSRGDVDAGLIEEAGTRRAGGGTLHNTDG